MKKYILTLIVAITAYNVAHSQTAYHIRGTVGDVPIAKIALVTTQNNKVDTLGIANVHDGSFTLAGDVTEIVAAYITLPDTGDMIPIMLENGDFIVNVQPNGITISGGEAHKLYNDFNRIAAGLGREQAALVKEYQAASSSKNLKQLENIETRLDSVFQQATAQELALIESNADHYVTAYVISLSMPQTGYDDLIKKYEMLGATAKSSTYGKVIKNRLDAYDNVAAGRIAPDFSVFTPNGTKFTLYGINSKLKLIYFWTSADMTCRSDNVGLIDLYRQYNQQGLEIISISLDIDSAVWKSAIGQDGMIWRNGSDLKGAESELIDLYVITDVPHTLLLDSDNRIIAKDLRGRELRKTIGELLKKKH